MKQLVVFICKDSEWDLYTKHNPGFQPTNLKNNTWLFHADAANSRMFVVMKWESADRTDIRDKFLKREQPRDLTQMQWCRLLQNRDAFPRENATKVFAFVHWGDTANFEDMQTASEGLQTFLQAKPGYATWEIFGLSSHNMDVGVGPIGRVFDVGEPIVPVSNFDAWFEMYKKWWKDGRDAVETAYAAPTPFPNHKDGRIVSHGAPPAVPRVDAAGNAGPKVEQTIANPIEDPNSLSFTTQREGMAPQRLMASEQSRIHPAKSKNVWTLLGASFVGLIIAVLSLIPVGLAYQCLRASSFQAKTTRGTFALLLAALIATAFSELVLGCLLMAILHRRHGEPTD